MKPNFRPSQKRQKINQASRYHSVSAWEGKASFSGDSEDRRDVDQAAVSFRMTMQAFWQALPFALLGCRLMNAHPQSRSGGLNHNEDVIRHFVIMACELHIRNLMPTAVQLSRWISFYECLLACLTGAHHQERSNGCCSTIEHSQIHFPRSKYGRES